MEEINWPRALFVLMASGLAIGLWVLVLFSLVMTHISRGSLVLFSPSQVIILLTTFLMLGGVTTLSLQLADIVEKLRKGKANLDH